MGVNWALGLVRWWPHVDEHSGTTYPLHHLHPFRFDVQLVGTAKYPAIDVEIAIGFSMHVFTRGTVHSDDPAWHYRDDREVRTFDLDRYTFSQCLPEVMRTLSRRKCYHAKTHNFLTLGEPDGLPVGHEYQVYFDLKRWKDKEKKGGRPIILLVVQSAYAVPFGQAPRGRRRSPVGFNVLINSMLNGAAKPALNRPGI